MDLGQTFLHMKSFDTVAICANFCFFSMGLETAFSKKNSSDSDKISTAMTRLVTSEGQSQLIQQQAM